MHNSKFQTTIEIRNLLLKLIIFCSKHFCINSCRIMTWRNEECKSLTSHSFAKFFLKISVSIILHSHRLWVRWSYCKLHITRRSFTKDIFCDVRVRNVLPWSAQNRLANSLSTRYFTFFSLPPDPWSASIPELIMI